MDTIKEESLVLRTCNSDMTSRNGFIWPTDGLVSCHDWIAIDECGNGLHGALWGEGDGSLFSWEHDAVWQVVKIDEYINLNGKVKFPSGIVVHTGDRISATEYIKANGASGAIIGGTATAGYLGTATAGDRGTATAGYLGTATAGDRGTATAGDLGTATAGDRGTATAGYRGTATAGEGGTATAGYLGTATAGEGGTATAGDLGTATAGEGGTATAGDLGTATAGDRGTATAGYRGTATAGDRGILQIAYYDNRLRIATAYVGENGILPNVKYKLNEKGEFVKS